MNNILNFSSWIISLLNIPFREFIGLQQDAQTPQKEKFAASIEMGKFLISVFGTLATALGGYMLILNFGVANKQAKIANEQAKIAQTRFVTETFSKAVENLESDKLAIRLGAIYSLERIASDSPKFYWMVINVLNAIVRDKSPLVVFYRLLTSKNISSQEEINKNFQEDFIYARGSKLDADVEAILVILGKASKYKEIFLHELGHIDLSKTELIGAKISSADFRKCYFYSTDFRCASIIDSNFSEAKLKDADFRWTEIYFSDFTKANLMGAQFSQAKLVETKFSEAKLLGAIFNQANLEHATFNQANLVGATFHYADLSQATFDGAKLRWTLENGKVAKADFRRAKNLDPKRIKQALDWDQALYDDEFRQRLGLPVSNTNT